MSDKQQLAERAAQVMWREDAASKWLGIEFAEVRPGYVRLSMKVSGHMTNGQKLCHGGLIFTLADAAFGFACNSHNQRSVGASCSIEYLTPAHLGDELTAEAQEVARAARSAVYDVKVTNQRQELVALFRGKSATVKGAWVE